MDQNDIDVLNNLDQLISQFGNWVTWIQRAKDIINNGRPSDQTTIATLQSSIVDKDTEITNQGAQIASLSDSLTAAQTQLTTLQTTATDTIVTP